MDLLAEILGRYRCEQQHRNQRKYIDLHQLVYANWLAVSFSVTHWHIFCFAFDYSGMKNKWILTLLHSTALKEWSKYWTIHLFYLHLGWNPDCIELHGKTLSLKWTLFLESYCLCSWLVQHGPAGHIFANALLPQLCLPCLFTLSFIFKRLQLFCVCT